MHQNILVLGSGDAMEVPYEHQITIGRDVFNALSLDDPEISRSHAIIFEQGDQNIVKDLNSRNGVYVNGDRVTEQIIVSGDEIIIGSSLIVFDPPPGKSIERCLSSRGEYIYRRLQKEQKDDSQFIFTTEQMDKSLDAIFEEPEQTTFFTTTNAIALIKSYHQLSSISDSEDLFHETLKHVSAILGGDRGIVMESDTAKEKLKVRAIRTAEDNGSGVKIHKAVLRPVLRSERCVFCADTSKNERFTKMANDDAPVGAFLAAPVMNDGVYFGFLYIDSAKPNPDFNYVALRSLYLIAAHLGGLLKSRQTRFVHDTIMREAAARAPR